MVAVHSCASTRPGLLCARQRPVGRVTMRHSQFFLKLRSFFTCLYCLFLSSILVGSTAVSGASGKDTPVQACSSENDPLCLRLTAKNSPVKFKCSQETPDVEPAEGNTACQDSDCKTPISVQGQVTIVREPVEEGLTLTLQTAKPQPETIYFNCVSKGPAADPGAGVLVPGRESGPQPKKVCKVQIAIWGELDPSVQPSVNQCSDKEDTVSIHISSVPATAVFTCGENGTMTPPIFEQAFDNALPGNPIELTEVLGTGKLVESGILGKAPIYTFSVAQLPEQKANIFYKCSYPGETLDRTPTPPRVCMVNISVAAAASPTLPGGDGPQTPITTTSTSVPTSWAGMNAEYRLQDVATHFLIGVAAAQTGLF